MSAKIKKYARIAYYPGCALDGSGHPYNRSTKAVGKALGLKLDEVKNWNCCGAMEVKNIDPELQTYLSSRVMAIASQSCISPCPVRLKNPLRMRPSSILPVATTWSVNSSSKCFEGLVVV